MKKEYTIEGGQSRKDSENWNGESFGAHDPITFETFQEADVEFDSAAFHAKTKCPAYDYVVISCEDLDTGLSDRVKTVDL